MKKYKQKMRILLISLIIPALFLYSYSQTQICYTNCKQGFCLPNSPKTCTACDLGQININGACVSSSSQPFPITDLTILPDNKLENSIWQIFNCSISNISFFNPQPQILSHMYFQSVPGTTFTRQFQIPVHHQYIQIKFNAVIVKSTTVFLQYQIQANNSVLFSTRQSTTKSDKEIQISCEKTPVESLFYIERSIASSDNFITFEIKTLDSNSIFGISNLYLYYGSCHEKCRKCKGPTEKQCTTCQGLYMRLNNGTCETCSSGFYDNGKQCVPCPLHCKVCDYNKNIMKPICKQCMQHAQLKNGVCTTNFKVFTLPDKLRYTNQSDPSLLGWISSQSSRSLITLCGKYSLIGGISIGIQGTTLSKVFSNLQVHTTVDIMFTFFMIDQQPDELNIYQLLIDDILIQQKLFPIQPQNSLYTLSDQCGVNKPQMALKVELKNITHSNRNINVAVKSFKNFYGLRDFILVVKNTTNVEGCYKEINGKCLMCLDGFVLENDKCIKCEKGYYLIQRDNKCQICPIECQSCQININQQIICLTCYNPMQLVNGACKDIQKSIYLRQIIPKSSSIQQNKWNLYPKLPYYGITKCGKQTILGNNQLQYKFLTMTRKFPSLPTHRGIKLVFHLYQIDQYLNSSVFFTFNGKNITYQPKLIRKQICGQQRILDSVSKINLEDLSHVDTSAVLEVHVNGKIKIGINNVVVFLLNCDNCNNQVGFEVETIPIYSLTTPPVKGLEVKLIFDEKVNNSTNFRDIFMFSLENQQTNLQQVRLLQGLIQLNQKVPIITQKINNNKQYKALINLNKDYNQQSLKTNPNNFWDLKSNNNGQQKIVTSVPLTSEVPRYINLDQTDVNDRGNIKNLKNLLQGCAVFALWIGLTSFIFGISSAFDDFFIATQVLFAHIFIQLANHPPSFRLVLQGLQIVQFMAWLPSQARDIIQKSFIPSQVYIHSPIQFQQYWTDIIFIRGIYHVIIFLLIMIGIFLLLKIFVHILSEQKNKKKFWNNYFVKYYSDYQHYKFNYLDRVVRFVYFTVIWACAVQFINFGGIQPTSYKVGNGIFCIVVFVIFAIYPLLGYWFLRKQSNTMSQATFEKKFQDTRIRTIRLYHFIIRYYKLLTIALLIPLLYSINPLATLIPLIIIHLTDGLLILFLKPFGLTQQQRLNVCFYNYYPIVYWIASIIQNFLFVILQIVMVIMYAMRVSSSTYSYMHVGYACCVFVVLILINGLVRLACGLAKIIEGCHSKSKEMELQVEQKKLKDTEPNEELIPMKTIKSSMANLNNIATKSKLMTQLRKPSFVSKIM